MPTRTEPPTREQPEQATSPQPADKSPRPIFVVRLLATRPDAAIRGLRWVLKHLGRAHGFRCLSIDLDRGQP